MPPRDRFAPLAGFTVGITSRRSSPELGSVLAGLGARIQHAPAIRIVEPSRDRELRAATDRLLAAPPDVVVVTTGRGFAAWVDAGRRRRNDEVRRALDGATVVARGPKTAVALAELGIRIDWSTPTTSWAEVMVYLQAHDLVEGRRVAVQLHGEPLRGLVTALEAQGADVLELPVYRWIPPADEAPLRQLIEATAAQAVDAVAFTSAPASASFLRTADRLGLLADVTAALSSSVLCACVGSVSAWPMVDAGIPVTMPPEPRLAALAGEIVSRLPQRAPALRVAGHELEVRGYATVVDDVLVPLPAGSMALLHELVRRPGQVISRNVLAALLPGESSEGHAVEVAIGRLRHGLGDPAIVQTVVKRGYRLSVDGGGAGGGVASRAGALD